MDKQKVNRKLSDFGVVEHDLANIMGIDEQELHKIINQNDVPDDFLKKIEKSLGGENIFFMNNVDNISGDNNNSNAVVNKLLDIIKEQNDIIKEQNDIIKVISIKK